MPNDFIYHILQQSIHKWVLIHPYNNMEIVADTLSHHDIDNQKIQEEGTLTILLQSESSIMNNPNSYCLRCEYLLYPG
jgi:hypothetical protein